MSKLSKFSHTQGEVLTCMQGEVNGGFEVLEVLEVHVILPVGIC